jgi:hypothetical protein
VNVYQSSGIQYFLKKQRYNVPYPEELTTALQDQKAISKNKCMSILQTLSRILKQKNFSTLIVKKSRETYLFQDKDCNGAEGVIVEIAKISEPEYLYSLSLKHGDLNGIKSALSCLNLSVDSHPEIKPLSYLKLIGYWFDGRKLY